MFMTKKSCIYILSLVILMLLTMNFSFAQQRKHHRPPPIPNDDQIKEMTEELNKELSLTEEQTNKISILYFKHFKEMRKNAEMNTGNKQPDREEHEKLRKDFHNEIKAFLTEEQKKKLDEFVRKQHHKQGAKKGKGLNK